jgi:hypothetical protein
MASGQPPQSFVDAIALGQKNAQQIIQSRTAARARRASALAANTKSYSMRVHLAAAAAPETVSALQTSGFLAAAGDSWFDYPFHDVIKDLEDNYGYDVESTAHAGDPIEKMAYGLGQLSDFPRKLDKIKALGAVPRACLLSGGGDDIAGTEFGMLLNNADSPIAGWDNNVVNGVLNDRIKTAYLVMISCMDRLVNERFGKSLPILVHGYDYPVPDGRGFLGAFGWYFLGPWLEPGFREKNFLDLTRRTQMMHDVIDRFNNMVQSLTVQFTFVHYVDLRNTLSTVLPDLYKKSWDNELHPTEPGFESVTNKFAAVLQTLP